MVLNQFLPAKECFHKMIMLFISWHTNYSKNCKWYFQTVFDFICSNSFYFRSVWQIEIRSKKQVDPALDHTIFLNKKYFLLGIIQINFKYWYLSYFRLLFSYCHFKWQLNEDMEMKTSVKFCLKFSKSVESSAS